MKHDETITIGSHDPLETMTNPIPYCLWKPYNHRIHGAAIYGNMDPINLPSIYHQFTWESHDMYPQMAIFMRKIMIGYDHLVFLSGGTLSQIIVHYGTL